MAIKTRCQTNGAVYSIRISDIKLSVTVHFGRDIPLTAAQAKLLEDNVHNALELVLARYYPDKA